MSSSAHIRCERHHRTESGDEDNTVENYLDLSPLTHRRQDTFVCLPKKHRPAPPQGTPQRSQTPHLTPCLAKRTRLSSVVHASSPRSKRFNPHRHCPPLTATSFSRGFLPWAFSNTCPCLIINASVGQVSKKPNQLRPFPYRRRTAAILLPTMITKTFRN
jgi:hypothetical protein